ncbi:MAG: ABC transporter permease [Bacteroidaceae bacterium]|nr:ABC transporter permease [Bacteroidaceae bacterium]
MIKQYFKQAWTMMRQNKLFTSIYVAGTGLSIAFTMVLFIIYYVKFAPVYPEYNRDRMLVINKSAVAKEGAEEWNNCNGGASPKVAELVKDLPHLEHVGMASMLPPMMGSAVLLPQSNEQLEVTQGFADAGFWKVFTFRFLSGKPFNEEAVEASLPVAVLTENLAKRIFASTDVIDKHFKLDGKDVKVIGVVEDVTGTTPATAADLYLPLYYGMGEMLRPSKKPKGLLGDVGIYMTAPSENDVEALRAEVIDVLNRYDQEDTQYTHFWMDQPDVWWKSTFRDDCRNAPDIAGIIRNVLYMLLALLFIPAMNLCGMISSRMDERMSELGVRKAYGATNASLISQVLTENLLLTLVGGLVGLALAYFIALTGGDWVYHLFDTFVIPGGVNPSFTVEMLFNPTLFLTVFGLCVLLNLISALVPTILALRHSIIYSIQSKR